MPSCSWTHCQSQSAQCDMALFHTPLTLSPAQLTIIMVMRVLISMKKTHQKSNVPCLYIWHLDYSLSHPLTCGRTCDHCSTEGSNNGHACRSCPRITHEGHTILIPF